MKFRGLSVVSERDDPVDIHKDRTYPELSTAETAKVQMEINGSNKDVLVADLNKIFSRIDGPNLCKARTTKSTKNFEAGTWLTVERVHIEPNLDLEKSLFVLPLEDNKEKPTAIKMINFKITSENYEIDD